ncbi:hypothetical protein C8P68_105294 [Mucilaginibacter yixingensis]|uniref:Uncharacterized protein n=1 Tax=Mucilaginibacter yixingensis TaxID=1295612 RepID=A0A2T5J8R6_9SPHI|nr:hypothetical protein C8P68_105294 [Mucilaginibacter yixingensis]
MQSIVKSGVQLPPNNYPIINQADNLTIYR